MKKTLNARSTCCVVLLAPFAHDSTDSLYNSTYNTDRPTQPTFPHCNITYRLTDTLQKPSPMSGARHFQGGVGEDGREQIQIGRRLKNHIHHRHQYYSAQMPITGYSYYHPTEGRELSVVQAQIITN